MIRSRTRKVDHCVPSSRNASCLLSYLLLLNVGAFYHRPLHLYLSLQGVKFQLLASFLSISTCLCLYLPTHVCSLSAYLFLYLPVYVYIYPPVYQLMPISAYLYSRRPTSVYIYLPISIISISTYPFLYLPMYVQKHLPAYAYTHLPKSISTYLCSP